MKYIVIAGSILLLAMFGVVGWTVGAQDDIDLHRSCDYCGMDRKAYGYSRMLIRYEDGSEAGTCSLHCTITELDEHKDKKVKSLLVADRDTHALLDADKAIWVMGGKKRGVMTQRAKWAFAAESAARKFVEAYGGSVVTWEQALAAAREDAVPKPRR